MEARWAYTGERLCRWNGGKRKDWLVDVVRKELTAVKIVKWRAGSDEVPEFCFFLLYVVIVQVGEEGVVVLVVSSGGDWFVRCYFMSADMSER